MKRSPLPRWWLTLVCLLAGPACLAAGDFPYRGRWSNGRGETLLITAKTLRFAGDPAVPYRDITRATDGNLFALQIIANRAVNGFGGNFLSVRCQGKTEMKLRGFASHADLLQDRDLVMEATWYQDAD